MAARHGGVVETVAVVVVVAVAVVLVDVLVVLVAVVALGAAALAVVDVAVVLVVVLDAAPPAPELPHAARSTASERVNKRFMGRVALGIAGRVPLSRTDMDPSEELRQTPPSRAAQSVSAVRRILPFWEPQLVIACAIVLQLSLSKEVTVGPTWLLPALEGALLIALVALSMHPNAKHSPWRRRVAIGMIGFVSLANIVSLVLLTHQLLRGGKENGHALILSGIVLWCTNVLLFGLWYWEVDRGGPIARARGEPAAADFLFPQMTDPRWAPPDWRPKLIDYLYVSLTNATAFSPTDTMPLSPAAKWMMSAQSIASLVTVGLVVARAVNILGT